MPQSHSGSSRTSSSRRGHAVALSGVSPPLPAASADAAGFLGPQSAAALPSPRVAETTTSFGVASSPFSSDASRTTNPSRPPGPPSSASRDRLPNDIAITAPPLVVVGGRQPTPRSERAGDRAERSGLRDEASERRDLSPSRQTPFWRDSLRVAERGPLAGERGAHRGVVASHKTVTDCSGLGMPSCSGGQIVTGTH
ncbi:unnamed protein product [Lampetra planeri]